MNPILFWLVVLGAPVAGLWLWVQNIRRGERHRIMPLPSSGHPGDRAALRVRDQMNLRRHTTPTAPQTLPIRDRHGQLARILVIRWIPLCS